MQYQVEVRFSSHLKQFLTLPETHVATGESVMDVVRDLEKCFPGLIGYLLHENGTLRQHVNLFLDNRIICDRNKLSDSVESVRTIHIMQALSGG